MVLLYLSPVKTCDILILERTVELFQCMKKNERAQTPSMISHFKHLKNSMLLLHARGLMMHILNNGNGQSKLQLGEI